MLSVILVVVTNGFRKTLFMILLFTFCRTQLGDYGGKYPGIH